MKRVAVVGSGNVATHLIKSLSEPIEGFLYVGQYARRLSGEIPVADIYIIAVSDDAIAEVSRLLPISALVLHTSGSKPIETIDARISRRGVLYPLQTFSSDVDIDMKLVPFFVECSSIDDMAIVVALASALGGTVTHANSAKRKMIHIAAVFSCNFTNHMYAIAQGVLRDVDLDFSIMEPLVKEGMRKAFLADNIYKMQTGPAIRGDWDTIKEHQKMLSIRGDNFDQIYNDITNSIIRNGKF